MPGTSPLSDSSRLRILLLEDSDWDAKVASEAVAAALPGARVVRVTTLTEVQQRLDAETWDVALVDLNVSDSKGLATLQRVIGLDKPGLAIIALTGQGDERTAQQAMAMGAQDFLQKNEDLSAKLGQTVRFAVERQRLAAALMGMGEMHMRILDSMGDFLIVADMQGKVRQVNPALADVLGPGWRGKSIFDYVPTEQRDQAILETGRMQEKGKRTGEAPLRCVDGSVRQVLWTGTLLRDRSGNPTGMVAVGKDITELRQLEARSAEAKRVLEGAQERDARDKERTLLINAIAHELNNPLTPIRLQLALARLDREEQGPRLAKALDIIGRNVDRMAAIISDMLDIARLQGGRMRIELKPTDVGHLCADMGTLFEPIAKEKGIQLRVDVPRDWHARLDPERFGQILINLLSNAVKFTPEGGRIVLHAQHSGDQLSIHVTDTGKGMSEEEIGRLFRPFSLVNEESTAKGGLGLGLFISKGIAQAHGGSLSATSQGPGRGSTFSVHVPVDGPAPAGNPGPV